MGWRLLNDTTYKVGQKQNQSEVLKMPKRMEVINFLLSLVNDNASCLEIGVRDPDTLLAHTINELSFICCLRVHPSVSRFLLRFFGQLSIP